jgi:transposase
MNGNVVYVGIDVDDVQYHGSALDRQTGEVLNFQCRPTLKGLIGQLDKVRKHFGGVELKLCYEASYVGFSLQRDLAERSYPCEVVSPSSIPRRAGKSVKTDRIDAGELAEYYANGLLSVVAEPDAEVEQDRDLLRSRQRLIHQQGDLRRHIQSLLRRNGLHYKAECASKTHWRTHQQGNRYLRTALIEANQRGYRSAVLGKDVKARRAKSRSQYVAIAERCLQRLNRKGNRLLLAGKHPNKVKVACAREMVGFVWESLNQAAAA